MVTASLPLIVCRKNVQEELDCSATEVPVAVVVGARLVEHFALA